MTSIPKESLGTQSAEDALHQLVLMPTWSERRELLLIRGDLVSHDGIAAARAKAGRQRTEGGRKGVEKIVALLEACVLLGVDRAFADPMFTDDSSREHRRGVALTKLMQAQDWPTRRKLLEMFAELLLDPETDALLENSLERGDPIARGLAFMLRRLLSRCREVGTDVACRELAREDGDSAAATPATSEPRQARGALVRDSHSRPNDETKHEGPTVDRLLADAFGSFRAICDPATGIVDFTIADMERAAAQFDEVVRLMLPDPEGRVERVVRLKSTEIMLWRAHALASVTVEPAGQAYRAVVRETRRQARDKSGDESFEHLQMLAGLGLWYLGGEWSRADFTLYGKHAMDEVIERAKIGITSFLPQIFAHLERTLRMGHSDLVIPQIRILMAFTEAHAESVGHGAACWVVDQSYKAVIDMLSGLKHFQTAFELCSARYEYGAANCNRCNPLMISGAEVAGQKALILAANGQMLDASKVVRVGLESARKWSKHWDQDPRWSVHSRRVIDWLTTLSAQIHGTRPGQSHSH